MPENEHWEDIPDRDTARVVKIEKYSKPNRWATFTDDELETLHGGIEYAYRLDPPPAIMLEIGAELDRRRQAGSSNER